MSLTLAIIVAPSCLAAFLLLYQGIKQVVLFIQGVRISGKQYDADEGCGKTVAVLPWADVQ